MTRVLVVGGTGVLGRALVPRLVARGDAVTVLARGPAREELIRGMGAEPVNGDIFDPASLARAAAEQNVIVHLATSHPRAFPGRPADFAQHDRVRREGTHHLLAAAAHAGARRVVVQSIIWVHGDQQGRWVDEDAELQPGVLARSAVDAEAMTREAAAHHGFAADILRLGSVYAADSWHTREILARLRNRTAPLIGDGASYQCFVHADDAAAAFAAAAAAPGAGDTYFVVDDEPVTLADYLRWVARASGAPAPLAVPEFLARLTLGAEMADAYTASLRCRNARLRRQLGWAPRFPTFRDGYPSVLEALRGAR